MYVWEIRFLQVPPHHVSVLFQSLFWGTSTKTGTAIKQFFAYLGKSAYNVATLTYTLLYIGLLHCLDSYFDICHDIQTECNFTQHLHSNFEFEKKTIMKEH